VTEPPPGIERLAWPDGEPPTVERVLARLREAGVAPYAWSNGPGDEYGAHRHAYRKRLICAAGSITFRIGRDAAPIELSAGDGFVLPAGTEHSATVGSKGCTCVEGHEP
jgi:quercetin dioxygenase-like cupin family protein